MGPKSFKLRIIYFFNKIRTVLLVTVFNFLLISVLISMFEDIRFWDAAWFVHVTSFTVGYGDIFPKTDAGRLTTIYAMYSMWFLFALMLALIIDAVRFNRDHFSHEEQEELKGDLDDVDGKTDRITSDVRHLIARLEQAGVITPEAPKRSRSK